MTNSVTHYENGLSINEPTATFSTLPVPVSPKYVTYFDDFDTFNTSLWNTVQLSGTTTLTLLDEDNGVVQIQSDTAAARAGFSSSDKSWLFDSDGDLWFEIRMQLNGTEDAADIFFAGFSSNSNNGAGTLSIAVSKESGATEDNLTVRITDGTFLGKIQLGTIVYGEYFTAGIRFLGETSVEGWYNGSGVDTLDFSAAPNLFDNPLNNIVDFRPNTTSNALKLLEIVGLDQVPRKRAERE